MRDLVPLFTITVTKTLIHHGATEDTERRVLAHSREIPRMGNLLVRLPRRLDHLFSLSFNSTTEHQFSRVFIQNPSHKPGTHLSFAGTCPAVALSHSTLLIALSKIEGLVEGATADLPANERFGFLCVLCASVVNTCSYLRSLILRNNPQARKAARPL